MMNNMKRICLFANILAVLAVAAQLTGCLESDDPYTAGFDFMKPVNVRTNVYANTSTDSLIMLSQGPWQITADTPDARWCTIDLMTGEGFAIYALGVHFEQNTTGQQRLVQFTVTDTNHPDKAYASWQYLQYATRGDGSFGSAALVRGIRSSDKWEVSISYDAKSRPVQMNVKSPEGTSEQYRMAYNENSATLSLTTADGTLTGAMDNGYQTDRLVGAGDTIGYAPQYYSNGMEMPISDAFSYVASRLKRTQAFAYLIDGKNLNPDNEHTADSLIYLSRWKHEAKPQTVEHYKLQYGTTDNRYQTVDVNQLLLGMDECEPLQLISMFRLCRSTSIVTRATSATGTIDVATELNADRSVRRIVVSDSRKGTEVTYDFEY